MESTRPNGSAPCLVDLGMVECSEVGCSKPCAGRGLCKSHYDHARRNGTLHVYRRDPVKRFWARIQAASNDECWPWSGKLVDGYGKVEWGGKWCGTHRVAYELTVGPIPDGLELDHLCHTRDSECAGGESCLHRRCANPAHLEPVTGRENWRRGLSPHAKANRQTHCAKGHEFTAENTVVYPNRSQRVCLTCKRAAGRETMRRSKDRHREYMRAYRARAKAAQPVY